MFVVRHWLFSTLFVLALLVAYTESPLYGAEPTPTPNVSTVPKPGLFVTPTATLSPVVVIITQAAPTGTASDATTVNGTPSAAESGDATPAAQPALETSSTSNATNGNATGDQSVLGSNRPGNRPESVMSTDGTRLIVAVTPSQTLIWSGALFQLTIVVTNRGSGVLSKLEVRQPLAAALHYQGTAPNQAGSIQVEQSADKGAELVMRWPTLAPGTTVSRTVLLQVNQDTPNGLFLDNHVVAQSAEGAMATVALTLVMPPTMLPQFRWDQRK